MNRRTFLETATTVTAAALLANRIGWAAADHKIDRLGVQLYTVRDQMKADFEGTLAKVAAIGYKEVDFAGYFDHPPKDARAILDRLGLVPPSTHGPYDVHTDNWPGQHESANISPHS